MDQFRNVFELGAWAGVGCLDACGSARLLGVIAFRWAGCGLRTFVVARLGKHQSMPSLVAAGVCNSRSVYQGVVALGRWVESLASGRLAATSAFCLDTLRNWSFVSL